MASATECLFRQPLTLGIEPRRGVPTARGLRGTLVQLREWQLGCGSDQRRSMLAGQPVEVVKPPATRRGRWGLP
jgi:hypothetical protein